MLLELVIENLAVIDRVRVQFHPGFTVLTGETGSGKSIVVDALGLLFGARASTDMLRSGTDRARVSGIFEAPPAALPVLEAAGAGIEDGELLIEREILAGGKSRVFVGSRPATAALLRDLAPHLGDIHGQHDQQQLFSSAAQLEILDEFAGTPPLLSELAGVFAEYRATARELEEIEKIEQEKLRLLDLWTFQSSEIAAARLTPDEDAALENERRVLQNVARLSENANTAYAALYDAPESAYAQIRQARRRLDDLVRIDGSLAALLDTLRAAEIAVDDASGSLRDYLGRLEADPQRLELVESRLAIIDRLKRKYGAAIEDILRFQGEVVAQIQAAESTSERRAAIEKRRSELAALYEDLAGKLSSRREQAARRLEKRVEAELKQLAMERTRFQVRLGRGEWSARGLDEVAFLVSPNLGEEPRALEKIASGGELSRIALALKTCVAGL
ncbi:MAG: DNA repair protein RecN, partial [Acidobacteria bacterium]|nr:DNA repair protein RecN [Acidobacteriota bacterium]